MNAIILSGENGSAQITLESNVQLRIVGAAFSAGGPVLASFQAGQWYLGTSRFDRITCAGQVDVEFQSKTGTTHSFGPFSELVIEGPFVRTPLGVLAEFRALEEVWSFAEKAEADIVVVKNHEQLSLAA